VSFAAITLCIASQQVFVVVYFVIYSVRKLLVTSSYYVLLLLISELTIFMADFGASCQF
jgi:hypothetical protein